MVCSSACVRAAARLLLVLAGTVAFESPSFAGETPLFAAGAFYESSKPTLAPLVVLRLPVGRSRILTLSQLGWTSAVELDVPETPEWSWRSGVTFTPLRAHLSHDAYDARGRSNEASEFDATALRATAGAVFTTRFLSLSAHLVAGKEWLSGLAPALIDDFRPPFFGIETSVGVESLRSEDPLRSRIDGIRISGSGGAFHASRGWVDTRLLLSLGRKWGPVFLRGEASAFFVTFDHPATRAVLGGSWDVLGASALVGHPLGAFRLRRGAVGTAGLDLNIVGPLEVGMRASVLAGAPVVHSGLGLLTATQISGIQLFAGVASPDGAFLRDELLRTVVFGGANGALFFLP